jgi:type II secretory pathway component PulC
MIKKYIKKPVELEAVQYSDEIRGYIFKCIKESAGLFEASLAINRLKDGDWMINEKGYILTMPDKEFRETYEEAND